VSFLPKRRRVWVVACLAIVACAGATFLLAYPSGRRGPFWDKYQKVQPGMADEEVEEILAPPMREEYPGESLGPRVCFWDEGQLTIRVSFWPDEFLPGEHDPAWRVGGKHFLPPTAWETLEEKLRRNGYDLRRWAAGWP
jgi:hypothetical protein